MCARTPCWKTYMSVTCLPRGLSRGDFDSQVAQAGRWVGFYSMVTLSCSIKEGCCLAEGWAFCFWNSRHEGSYISLGNDLNLQLLELTWSCCSHVSVVLLSAVMLVFKLSYLIKKKKQKNRATLVIPKNQHCEHEYVSMQKTSACCIRVSGCILVVLTEERHAGRARRDWN